MDRIKQIDLRYIGDKSDIINITNKKYSDVIPGINPFLLARNIYSTVGDVSMYPDWYILDHSYFYFKKNDTFNELLMVELFKEFKLKCLEYRIAKDNGKIGILSKNFRKKGSRYIEYGSYFDDDTFYSFSTLGEFDKYMSEFISSENLNALIASISRLLVVDFFSGQSDRNGYNLLLEEGKDLKLAPISDNGDIFYKKDMNISRSCVETIRFPNEPTVNTWEYRSLNLIINNAEFRTYLIKCLDININEVINRTIDKYYLRILKSERKEIISYFDTKKSIIDNTLKLIKKEN